jgi:hypothetical protein
MRGFGQKYACSHLYSSLDSKAVSIFSNDRYKTPGVYRRCGARILEAYIVDYHTLET